VAVIVGLLVPIPFSDRSFSTDWGNHLWLIWVQGNNIGDLGAPSYFLQSTLGVFYPYYAFYGGSFYAVFGLVSWLTSAELAVFLAYAGALSATYLGWTWIARLLGVVGWRSQLPGCIAVTAPLAVTNLYGRGDIPEVVATAAIPLIVAAGLSLFREERVRLSTACLYVVGIVALTGTHTLTLVWGTVFLLVLAAILIACYWRATRERIGRGLALGGLSALGVGINAWILAPLFLFHTRLVEREPDPIGLTAYTDPEQLFSLFRNIGDPYPIVTADVNAQLPVLALLWALICGGVYWRYLPAAAKRASLGILALGCALLLLILSPSLIAELPTVLQFIQFPYRIETFVNLCVVGLVTLALAAMQRDPSSARIPALALAGIAAFSFGLSIDQNSNVRSWLSDRDEALASPVQPPSTWYAPLQFADGSAAVVDGTSSPLELPVEEIKDGYAATYPPGRAGVVETNIVTGGYLVDVSGADPVGRTAEGRMVVRLPAGDRPRAVAVKAAWGPAMTVGRWLTIVSLMVGIFGAGAYLVVSRRSPR
jgi:hypothetical protein